MKKILVRFTCMAMLFLASMMTFGQQSAKKWSDYVKPNIGTAHSRWFFYTPGAMPFGLAKLGPSTNGHLGNVQGWEATGYDDRDTSIEGFACLHEFQVGGIVLAPSVGKLQTIPGSLDKPEEGYRSRFDRKDEYATAGYYSVLLKDYKVKAELTATKRVGFQRYTFPKSSQSNIIFDIGNRQGESGAVKESKVTITEDGRIEGYVITMPEYVKIYQAGADVAMYFSAVLDKKPTSFGTFNKQGVQASVKEITGEGAGVYLTFDTKENEMVTVKIGLSYTSIANARLNLDTEAKNLDFAAAKKQSQTTWNEYLGRIAVEGKNEKDKIKFYTGLYHALLGRGLGSDVNGAYPMNNGKVGQIPLDAKGQPQHNYYNTDAIWGGFWNLTQLWALAYPEYYADWVQGQLLVYKDAGWLGDGIANSKYVSGVGTNFTGLAIASAYNSGIHNFDVEKGYEAALKNELEWKDRIQGAGKMDVKQFVALGYSPYLDNMDFKTNTEGSGFSASHTLEYSFSAYAVAQFAKALGKTKDYEKLIKLADGWKLIYDKETAFIRPKYANGEFIKNFDPSQPWRGFQEGNAWQYTFYVPHNVPELVSVLGKDTFNERLNTIFTKSQKNVFGGGTTIDAFAGLSGFYNHGNQPNLHISWLFNFSGKPALTQKWVHAICDEFYGTEGIHGYGYGQDEDQGQLGAWYVMSSIGLFDVKGLTDINPSFQIGSPLFDKITIKKLGKARNANFTINVKNNTKSNVYLQEVKLNDTNVRELSIDLEAIKKGGTLNMKVDSKPVTTWDN
ncbi:GH92 family glycosyl hydrolase [Flavobacterium hercynium]|uniref:Alpha-mannosidase n=1 Tax=Flavobacterium hercynium TaxID=387094 RepID=A0A226H759_9FLAO|nr:GH92 family glycosyl hydrolase [Flavobacterium hercynium]OXA90055.1 alpha-mannosidase [Flavobacterium hercynium]SMP14619.1 alpha-1,2-mannosidase, putative [Flavobacterium hercynium]